MHGTLPVRLTYKTAEELGFARDQWEALAWFVDEVDAGRILDAPNRVISPTWAEGLTPPQWFYMDYVRGVGECGTAGCIVGWTRHKLSSFPDRFDPRISVLVNIFPRKTRAVDARDATVRVLRGEPAWP
jgi:hypothetical protein